jgi:hypothetical protein
MSKSFALVFVAAFAVALSVGCDKKPEGGSSSGGSSSGSASAKTEDNAKGEDYDKMLDEYCACKDKACVDLYEDKKLTGEVLSKLTPEQTKKMSDCAFKLPK